MNNAAVGSSTVERYVDGGDMARTAAFPPQRHDLESSLPGGRLLAPHEVAAVVYWLASPDAILHGAWPAVGSAA